MADYVTGTHAPSPGGVYLTPMGGVRFVAQMDLSGGVDGNWTIATFDQLGNLRVASTSSLFNGLSEEPQKVDGIGTGSGLVADLTVRQLLIAILFESVQSRKMQYQALSSIMVDYVPPLYDTIDSVAF